MRPTVRLYVIFIQTHDRIFVGSCGDSVDPGKLSGPNLFTLLSKLGVLSDVTLLSDVGILLHQISTHSHAHSPLAIAIMIPQDLYDSPSLSFEDFMIFLCAFSQLRFEGYVSAPIGATQASVETGSELQDQENWFNDWQHYMSSSMSFRKLLEECILPILRKHPVLALPEDARQRDKYSVVFSLEVLLSIEGSERPLLSSFELEKSRIENFNEIVLAPLRRLSVVPQVVQEVAIEQLLKDILPSGKKASRSKSMEIGIVFPQWEWIICVVSYHAVETAILESPIPTDPSVGSPPSIPSTEMLDF